MKVISPGDRMTVAEYMKCMEDKYIWNGVKSTRPNIFFLIDNSVYTDHWITGNHFYVSNDGTADSVDLSPIRKDLEIELIEKV